MRDESKQLVEQMVGDAEARVKRMKQAAVQVAAAVVALRGAASTAADAVGEYMEASGVSKTQLVADLGLTAPEARLLGLVSPSRSRAERERAKHADGDRERATDAASRASEAAVSEATADDSGDDADDTSTDVDAAADSDTDAGVESVDRVWEVSGYGA